MKQSSAMINFILDLPDRLDQDEPIDDMCFSKDFDALWNLFVHCRTIISYDLAIKLQELYRNR